MPPIERYGCNSCDFKLPGGWGGYTYAVDENGERILCPHPGEGRRIAEITGLGSLEAFQQGRAGHASYCICLACLSQFDLDLKRDAIVCPNCKSENVRSAKQMVGQACPVCRSGRVEAGSLVRWKLDPDWEQLPVPQIAKDLHHFWETREIREPLRQAAEIANEHSRYTFLAVVTAFLNWWEGNYGAEDKEQQSSFEIDMTRPFSELIPRLLEVTPALSELVLVHGNHCHFREHVSLEVRRGMKNYLRKHRKHEIWT